MSKYRFNISDYHAIENADILVDGITVLAGPNGSGKSTISKWLYYMVDVATRFDEYVGKGVNDEFKHSLQILARAIREIWGYRSSRSEILSLAANVDALKKKINVGAAVDEVAEKYNSIVAEFTEQVRPEFLSDDVSALRKVRVINYLKQLIEDSDNIETFDNFEKKMFQQTDKMLEDWEKRLSMRSIKDVYSFIEEYLREDDVAPESMQLWEDDVNIISEESLGSLFNIERAIYIDTPMALNAKNLADNVFLQRLHGNMTHSLGRTLDKSKMLLLRIARLLNGKISQSDSLLGETELYYERKDEHLKLPVEKIATGMKTFAYLYQLIKNGYLDDKTILMIDEPEVHLHPQWIVEYARLLVLIHKTLGTKLILASHDPDFIAAIKAIAKREEVLEETNFYISSSEEQECSYRYNFKWLGKDIEPIFESFNIALERIQQYGDTDI